MVEKKCDRWWGKLHKWGEWKVKEEAPITRGKDAKDVIGKWMVQERKCSRCGFVEFNKQQVNLE